MRENNIIIAFDFDGVLVDSYSRLEEVYVEALREHPAIKEMSGEEVRRLARELVSLEDYYDSIRQYDRYRLIETFLKTKNLPVSKDIIKKIVEKYWTKRIEKTMVCPDAEEILRRLHGRYTLILLTDHDGEPGMKLRRVKASGLDKYFNEIIVAGEPGYPPNKKEGIIYIMEKYRVRPGDIIFIDDKPRVLETIEDLGVTVVLRKFRPPNMHLAWSGTGKKFKYTIRSLRELEKIVSGLKSL